MKCSSCGAKISKNARVCKKCGAVQEFFTPEEPITNGIDMDLPELAEVVVPDSFVTKPRYINKALIYSIIFVVAVLAVVIYFYAEANFVDLPDDKNASVSVQSTTPEEKKYASLSDEQVKLLVASDWKDPYFNDKYKERAIDKMMYMAYEEGVTSIYSNYTSDDILTMIDNVVNSNSLGTLTIYERIIREVNNESTEDIGYEFDYDYIRNVEKYDWNNPKYTDDVKRTIAKMTLRLAYFEGQMELYYNYSVSEVMEIFDGYAKEVYKKDDETSFYKKIVAKSLEEYGETDTGIPGTTKPKEEE
ncbi:MAG: zinc ribbon domain-containing protein [Clostridia bacterium]|nr:zinc ribbon domain-containing protein [Clostridia bacterium]MBQ6708386.1 zinc ribbon domain-containing protein [Clostridia bacterium]